MKRPVIITILLTLLCPFLEAPSAGEIPREPLDRIWEEYMFNGTVSYYLDGKKIEENLPSANVVSEAARGSVAAPIREISVNDYRGTAFLGILRGGGWSVMGGLIGRGEGKASTLELYAKRVWREYSGLLGMWNYFRPKEDETYDVFLVQREQGASRGTILKKWVIQPAEIRWFIPQHTQESKVISEKVKQQNETSDVRGFLKYLSESQEAEVTITGLTHPFVEHFKVPWGSQRRG